MRNMSLSLSVGSNFPVVDCGKVLENSKSFCFIGSVVIGCYAGWKLLRFLSYRGNSKNPVFRVLHKLLRKYINCGFLMRSEFGVSLPWQFLLMFPGRFVIVNYGSYGTVPNKVMDYYISLQRELELYPDVFYRTKLPRMYEESLQMVAKFVGCSYENLVFVENVTEGINCALESFLSGFQDDDAVLFINIGYAAVLKTIAVRTKKREVKTYRLELKFPIHSEDEICNAFEEMFQSHSNIRLAVFDHITSASATCLPVQKIAELCTKYNVISVVDGAHAPGQLQLALQNYEVDVYVGNLHKWYYTPKSCAIVYIDPKHHDVMHPILVPHGCYGNLHERFRRQGTKNYSAQLTAGYAVGDFMESIGGMEFLRSYITPLVEYAVNLFTREWGTEELQIPDSMKAPYMRVVFLPDVFTTVGGSSQEDADRMIVEVLERYNLAIVITPVEGRQAVRVSAQIFSTRREYQFAASVIKRMAEEMKKKI